MNVIINRAIIAAVFLFGTSISAHTLADEKASLQPNDYVAIIGDSITEQREYSVFMEDYLLMCQPKAKLEASQFGWGGETAPGFAARMDNDLVPFHPSVATTCFGMNDGHYKAFTDDVGKNYLDGQKSVLSQLKKGGVRFIILGSSGPVDSDSFRKNPAAAAVYNKTLADLRDIDEKLAKDEGVTYADVYDPMMDVMTKAKAKYGHKYLLCGPDGVHPSANGHIVMAYAFLKAMGCDGNIGTITVDLSKSSAQGTEGHTVKSMKDGVVTVESTKYPFCFHGDPTQSNATTGVIEFFPFNQDLNRFNLVVSGASSDQLKVTFGKDSKVFKATDLAKGINLAAEFLDNPFSVPFMNVQRQIESQQNSEVDLVKQKIHNIPGYIQWVPDQKQMLLSLRDALVKADAPLREQSAVAVKPVTYTITIEAVK